MVASRVRTMGASSAPYWFSAFFIALMPTSIGYQDLAALFVHQQGIAQRMSEHLLASPFGTIERATFSYARPIGTSMPLARFQSLSDRRAAERAVDPARLSGGRPQPQRRSPAGGQSGARRERAGKLAAITADRCIARGAAGDFAACRAGADVAAQEHRTGRQCAADRTAGAIAAVSTGSAIAGNRSKCLAVCGHDGVRECG
jgi:hypothetical protein